VGQLLWSAGRASVLVLSLAFRHSTEKLRVTRTLSARRDPVASGANSMSRST